MSNICKQSIIGMAYILQLSVTTIPFNASLKSFFAKQFIHFIKQDTKNTENKSLSLKS